MRQRLRFLGGPLKANQSRVVSVVGARPQFIKAAMVERALATDGFDVVGIHTGQHYDAEMSQIFFEQLGLKEPRRNLNVGSGSHAGQTARMLVGLEDVLLDYRPDAVVVYGDTNSTLAASLSASKLNVPTAHVEAGLRSFRRTMPEEQNRIVADHLSTLLLAPSRIAYTNLCKEGLGSRSVVVGDVMFDAFQVLRERVEPASVSAGLRLAPGQYVLATIHRAENTDDSTRMRSIIEGLGRSRYPVVLPLHPRTRVALAGIQMPKSIRILPPIGYLEMLSLELGAHCIATDSGGVQKEALWAGKLCVTLRDETEWMETVQAGWNILAGADAEMIALALESELPSGPVPDLYGSGDAAARTALAIRRLVS